MINRGGRSSFTRDRGAPLHSPQGLHAVIVGVPDPRSASATASV
jgi:hypothetical protein